MYWKQAEKLSIAWCLEGLAGVAGAQGEPVRAARLLGAADRLRVAIGAPLPPGERADYDHTVDAARTQMAPDAFAASWAAGRAMTLEQAIAYALEEDDGQTQMSLIGSESSDERDVMRYREDA
jgi:hypothetical protein